MASAIRFSVNIPEVISLAFTQGREVESQFGSAQLMYTLSDGRKMYVPPFVGHLIEEQGIRKDEPFEIVKTEKGFKVKNLAIVNQTAPATATGGGMAVVPPAVHVASAAAGGNPTTLMMGAFASAIDTVAEAQEYATRKGLRITFTGEDVRCVANTLYIQRMKGGC